MVSTLKVDATKKCRCDICVFSTKVERVQKKLSPKDRAVIEELLLRWEANGTDRSYYQCIVNGTWPGTKAVPVSPTTCKHEWNGVGEHPSKFTCRCGTVVYRSYADYCWD